MVKLYIESMKLKLKSQLEYRLSFILTFISQIGVFFTYYFMTVALFQRFDNIKGFTLYEVLLCFSIIHFGFAFNETFFRVLIPFSCKKSSSMSSSTSTVFKYPESSL